MVFDSDGQGSGLTTLLLEVFVYGLLGAGNFPEQFIPGTTTDELIVLPRGWYDFVANRLDPLDGASKHY